MSVPAKLLGFAAVLVVVFVATFALGAATEPDGSPSGGTPTTVMDMDHGGEHGS